MGHSFSIFRFIFSIIFNNPSSAAADQGRLDRVAASQSNRRVSQSCS
ncbi:MAG: hypothetical protein K0S32_3491 [Bacteroidetes bacterium]|nr:hypothetical protein [Bacteroidota bacterium]